MERSGVVKRKTRETDISLELVLESTKESVISSGVPFFDHMLASMAKHGRMYIKLSCSGDVAVDDHHSVEDIGIALGQALKSALGNKAGIRRFGDASVPMDDALTLTAVDLSGRAFFHYQGDKLIGYIGRYSEELTSEFLNAFSVNAGINLHVNVFYGDNRHHIHESIFKSLGIALYKAFSIDVSIGGEIPSTKGMII